jgi:HAD superfamily hydrolase (TIGR01549 family)
MIAPRPKALVLDLFDTLVKWEPARLPRFDWNGQSFPSTVPLLLAHLRSAVPAWNHDREWIECYNAVIMEIAAQREAHGIEVTCLERFSLTMARMAPALDCQPDVLAEELRAIHMAAVRAATTAPAANLTAARRLAAHFRLGLLSNFDDAATGYQVVADTGLADLFEVIVLSAEVALRKPNPRIFRHLLERMALEPQEVLFVGDTPHEDVMGAQRAGIPVVWLSHRHGILPPEIRPPELIVPTLAELPAALGL